MLCILSFPIAILSCWVFHVAWRRQRVDDILMRWADANGLWLIRYRRSWRFWKVSGQDAPTGRDVVYVTVRDPQGDVHTGWVRCGSRWFGLFSDDAGVEWETPGADPAQGVSNGRAVHEKTVPTASTTPNPMRDPWLDG